MTQAALNNTAKSKAQRITEFGLLALCLSVLAVRATYTESPNVASFNPMLDVRADFYSLCLSAALIFAVLVWLVKAALSKTFNYRYSGIEIGVGLFVLATAAAMCAAANTRAAITDLATLIAPMLMALLLVQILDSHFKIKLVLYVIVAAGAANAYQCADQFFSSNQTMIKQYEQNPTAMLKKTGIEPGTYRHMLFEHRLYSKDVRGFFMTGNSAGSFALLAGFAATALLIENLRNKNSNPPGRVRLLLTAFVTAFVIFGLALTRSKGAIAAAVLSALMFAAYLVFAKHIKAHKKTIFALSVLLIIVVGLLAGWYGVSHGKLPGGKSMLVRWQYWTGAGKMFAENPLTGVGGGNFAEFYPLYKTASAPETVKDPHNFILSLLAQYGPLGLIGFLAAVCIPLYKTVFGPGNSKFKTCLTTVKRQDSKLTNQQLLLIILVVVSAVLLIVRPMFLPANLGDAVAVMILVIVLLYISPVIIFAAAFVFLSFKEETAKLADVTTAALFCAVIGVLIHNCVDFAIFEPGILTGFWAFIACLAVLTLPAKEQTRPIAKLTRVVMVTAALAVTTAFVGYGLIPVGRSTADVEQAKKAVSQGFFEDAHHRLAAAAEADRLSSTALYLNGRVYLQQFNETRAVITTKAATDLLLKAESSFREAAHRNSANFKYFERLTEAYTLLARYAGRQERKAWLEKALDSATQAVARYPGCGRLRVEFAKIAEQMDKTDVAVEQYKRAVAIEDAYRAQFKRMFPGREVFSRLGREKYQFAKERIKKLNRTER